MKLARCCDSTISNRGSYLLPQIATFLKMHDLVTFLRGIVVKSHTAEPLAHGFPVLKKTRDIPLSANATFQIYSVK